jgi:hypothetical protein
MKKKLRQIDIGTKRYLYSLSKNYSFKNSTYNLKVKIYLIGYKNTPLIINFTGDLLAKYLNSGVLLLHKQSNEIVKVNLNEPKNIKDLILQGQQNGWTGANNIEVQDGLKYLSSLGYELK